MPRFRIGRPLQSHVTFDQHWNSFIIFDQRRLLLSIAIGLILALSTSIFLLQLNSASLPLGTPDFIEFAVVIIILTIGHEALHLLGFPRFGFDRNSVIGLWPELCSPYVQYLLPMSRNKFIFACILPFLVLTILPITLVVAGVGPIEYLSWISVGNSVGVGSDFFVLIKLLSSSPKNSWVADNEERVYWKLFQEN